MPICGRLLSSPAVPESRAMTDQKETWIDWLPPENIPPESTWITKQQLLEELAGAGVTVSPRTLSSWESRGLLPRPVQKRRGRGEPAYYPPFHVDAVKAVASGQLADRNRDAYMTVQGAWMLHRWADNWNEAQWFYGDDEVLTALATIVRKYQAKYPERADEIDSGVFMLRDDARNIVAALAYGLDRLPLKSP